MENYASFVWEKHRSSKGSVALVKKKQMMALESNSENTVGVLTMAGKGVCVFISPTTDLGKILACVPGLEIGNEMKLVAGIQVVQLALKHRQNKKQQQRIIVFAGSPAKNDKKVLELIGKKLKKNSVALDIVNFGEEGDEMTEKLEALLVVNNDGSNYIVNVLAGPSALFDVLASTPIFTGDGHGGCHFATAAGGPWYEIGVDPTLDPGLALALRFSKEEDRPRQDTAAKKAVEARKQDKGVQGSTSQDATMTEFSSADFELDKKSHDFTDDENALLHEALAMSMDDPATNIPVRDTDMSGASTDDRLQFVQESAVEQSNHTYVNKLLGDQSFVSSNLSSIMEGNTPQFDDEPESLIHDTTEQVLQPDDTLSSTLDISRSRLKKSRKQAPTNCDHFESCKCPKINNNKATCLYCRTSELKACTINTGMPPLCNRLIDGGGLGGDDRISNLHSSIISHILSRLTFEEAVRTCILSKKWEFYWRSIYKIEISDAVWGKVYENLWKNPLTMIYEKKIQRDGLLNGKSASLANTMTRLSLSHHVTSLTLFCWENKYNLEHLDRWISSVMGPNLESFGFLYPHQGLVLPQSLLQCISLRNLELKSPCMFRVPSVVPCFPNLINLSLHSVEILNEDFNSTDILTLKFKVLETLELYLCKWLNVKFVEIHAPVLTTFKSVDTDVDQEHDHIIKIIGANLANLEITYGLNFVLAGSTIISAKIDCWFSLQDFHEDQLHVQKLLTELSSVKHLILKGNMIQAIGHLDRGLPLTEYDRLEHLDLYAGGGSSGEFEGLMKLLHATPYLKFLEMDVTSWGRDDEFDEVKTVPSCVISSLEKVRFRSYYYKDHQFELEKFLLRNGKQLKTVVLVLYNTQPCHDYVKQLSTIPRASSTSLDIFASNQKFTIE